MKIDYLMVITVRVWFEEFSNLSTKQLVASSGFFLMENLSIDFWRLQQFCLTDHIEDKIQVK